MGFGESLDAVVALIQTSVYREDCVFREAVVRVERIVDEARIKGKRGRVGRGGPRAKPPSRLDPTCCHMSHVTCPVAHPLRCRSAQRFCVLRARCLELGAQLIVLRLAAVRLGLEARYEQLLLKPPQPIIRRRGAPPRLLIHLFVPPAVSRESTRVVTDTIVTRESSYSMRESSYPQPKGSYSTGEKRGPR